MPILTKPLCFAGYPIQAIEGRLAEDLLDRRHSQLNRAGLLRLECFLQLTENTLSYNDLGTQRGVEILENFNAALFSHEFHNIEKPWNVARNFSKAIAGVTGTSGTYPPFPCTLKRSSWPSGIAERVESFEICIRDAKRARFWQGWSASNLRGREVHLALWPHYERYGEVATNSLHDACKAWFEASRRQKIPIIQDFVSYLSKTKTKVNLKSSTSLGEALVDFFQAHFRSQHANGKMIATMGAEWTAFVDLITNHLFGKEWTFPLPAVPRPHIRAVSGKKRNVTKSRNGSLVKSVLLTEVPLELSDSQAKEILFSRIEQDLELTINWARQEVIEARKRVERREQLAKAGIPGAISNRVGVNTGLHYRNSNECPEHLAHAAATFDKNGFPKDLSKSNLIYPKPLGKTAWEIGINPGHLLLAHAAILISQHPTITPSFIENLNIYDKSGALIGLQHTDAGWHLVGAKMRKGSATAEQKVLLNDETLQVVQDLITSGAPLRDWLRNQGSDSWRRLFLYSTSLGTTPRPFLAASCAYNGRDWIANRFSKFNQLSIQDATELANRFSLARIRCSAAVLVYLRTGSCESMAKALGHDRFTPKLLDHYLPSPIQEFFQERWVRIFQNGFICHALKGSRHLLEASSFSTMAQLDEFLENHALRSIPAHLNDPNPFKSSKKSSTEANMITFGLDAGILTILLSIQHAVTKSTRIPCGHAIRWARVSDVLFPHLESQQDQPEFREMVEIARKNADASKVEDLIYG